MTLYQWHYYYYYYYYYYYWYWYWYWYWYSALGPVWAETRVQSGDWYAECCFFLLPVL